MPGKFSVPRLVRQCILASVFMVLAGCSSAPEGERAEPAAVAADTGSAEQSGQLADRMTGLLPRGDDLQDWRLAGDPRIFVPDNLWEYINGGAEAFLVYDFQAVVTADYVGPDDLQAVLDIYRMDNRLCGYGIYSAERNPVAPRVDVGSEGYLTENALHFWQGPYYVKVTAFETGRGEELERLARAAAAELDEPAGMPAELEAFPAEGLQRNSIRYLAQDVLGHSELTNGFTADYEIDGREFKLFFMLHDTAEQAAQSYETYREFMAQYGEDVAEQAGEQYPLFTARDSYYGKVVAMQAGAVVVGLLGLEDPEMVNSYLQQTLRNLSAQDNV